ncbi:hypothetical protein NXW48_13705 [Phocaeicola vulgatus]|nr:hypothetical protein [Phocaeicola vulgatus]
MMILSVKINRYVNVPDSGDIGKTGGRSFCESVMINTSWCISSARIVRFLDDAPVGSSHGA